MEKTWVEIMLELGIWAIPFNLLVNTLLNLTGFIPSLFITTTNVLVWGPIWGGILSWLGELLGAIAAYILYRKGLRAIRFNNANRWRWLRSLHHQPYYRQWLLLILARLIPWIPTGAVNLLAALASVPFLLFLSSTALGKIPSIALEAGTGYGFWKLGKFLWQTE
ncbi:MAG: VTT domain-containing protein [Thermoactinomyces sp.]